MGRELAMFVALNQAYASAALLGVALASLTWALFRQVAEQRTARRERRSARAARPPLAAALAARSEPGRCAAWR
jgi:hypothetical protein